MKWTKTQEEFLRDNWRTMSHANMGKALNRPVGAIRTRCWLLGLTNPRHWSEEEIDYLKRAYKNAGKGPVNQRAISEHLGRTKNAVVKKASILGLANPKRKHILSQEARKSIGEKAKRRLKKNGHPRGMLGHTHSETVRKAQSERSKQLWADPNHYLNSEEYKQLISDRTKGRANWQHNTSNPYSRCRGGCRPDLDNCYFRSAWEANIARYLNLLTESGELVRWEYEPVTFEFHEIKRGTRSYTPDFRLWKSNGDYEWWEVKGWHDAKTKTRLKRFAKYYPEENEKLSLIGQDEYKAIAKYKNLISPFWEN